MAYYGIVFPEFWTGKTGRALRGHGKDAQLLALYLATNRHANMIGLYRLLVDDIRHETGLGAKSLERGFKAVWAEDFARFDAESSYVWVLSMARFRLGLQPGDALNPEDKKVAGVNRIYHALDPNPFLGEFYDVNHRVLRIKKRRESIGVVVTIAGEHKMSGLPSPLEAPSKPGTGSGIRKQDQVKNAADAASPPAVAVIRALARVVIAANPDAGFTDLKDLVKDACAQEHLSYDADAVGSALEQAIAQRGRHA